MEPSIWFEREGSKSKDLHTMLVEILMRYEDSVPKSQQSNSERLRILNFTLQLSAFYFILLSVFSLYLIWEKLHYI
jgi:hypothetical protein